jgi:hypothetical protein
MRYLIPLLAVILVAIIFPTHPLAWVAYSLLALYSVFTATGLLRKSSPRVRRQVLIASSCALFVALGIGAFIYFR